MKPETFESQGLLPDEIEDSERNVESWIDIVQSFITEQKYKKAEDSIRMALSVYQHCYRLWIVLGDLQVLLHQLEEAEESYLESMKISNQQDEEARIKIQSLHKKNRFQ